MNQLKMTSADDASASIVVSFDAKWADALSQHKISKVFRKRGPRNVVPDWMYVYVGSPVSALIGRCRIEHFEWLPIADSLAVAEEGGISTADLDSYAGDYDKLAVFTVANMEHATSPLTWQQLSQQFSFSPPQSFFVLSRTGRASLDELAGFTQGKGKRNAKRS